MSSLQLVQTVLPSRGADAIACSDDEQEPREHESSSRTSTGVPYGEHTAVRKLRTGTNPTNA